MTRLDPARLVEIEQMEWPKGRTPIVIAELLDELQAVRAERDAMYAATLPDSWQRQSHDVIVGNAKCNRQDAETMDALDQDADTGPQLRQKLADLATAQQTIAEMTEERDNYKGYRKLKAAEATLAAIRAERDSANDRAQKAEATVCLWCEMNQRLRFKAEATLAAIRAKATVEECADPESCREGQWSCPRCFVLALLDAPPAAE